jgi:flagellar motor switch protein FliM
MGLLDQADDLQLLGGRVSHAPSSRRSEATEEEHTRILNLLKPTEVFLDSRLEGPKLEVEDLLSLETGDVLRFDFPLEKPLILMVNGTRKFHGHVVAKGTKKAFLIESMIAPTH